MKPLRTRLRLLTVVCCMLLLAVLGGAGLSAFFGESFSSEGTIIKAAIALFFCAIGICCIIWLTLLIRVDESSRSILFIYPFRLQFRRYRFDELIGFRFRYLPGRVDYKALQLKTSDGRKFNVSDFETANLRELETWCLENLDLRSGSAFRELDPAGKQAEIHRSRQFDRRQLSAIRYYLCINALCLLVIGGALGYGMTKRHWAESTNEAAICVLLILLSVLMLRKAIRIHRQLKKKIEYAGNEPS